MTKQKALTIQILSTLMCVTLLAFGYVNGSDRILLLGILGLLIKDIASFFLPLKITLNRLVFGSSFNRYHRYLIYGECVVLVFILGALLSW